jgi:multiple sugar transport system permease protein
LAQGSTLDSIRGGGLKKPNNAWRTMFGERQRFMLMLIAPAVTLLILFQAIPIFIGGSASFRDWMLNDPKKTWVGLSQYTSVLSDPAFLEIVLPNTFIFMFASVIISLVIGLAIK